MFSREVSSKDRPIGRQSHQLPPGRHGLSRAYVAQNQRERILGAVADVTSAASYAEMTVEDIIVTAGVSRRTFYEHFKNKEEAFLAAYDEAATELVQHVMTAINSAEEDFADRARAGLGAFLCFLADRPALSRMCIVEALAAGPDAIVRRNGVMSAFAATIEEDARRLLDETAPSLTAETIVGGIYEVVYTRVLRGEIRELPELLPDIVYSALLPYLGPETAAAERRRLLDAQQVA
jgi:AcrR family transcriptional regulator